MAVTHRADHTVPAATRSLPHLSTAAAYCGPAHGLKWETTQVAGAAPAEIVELPLENGTAWYRLVRNPRTGTPAVDRQRRLIYVPASAFWRRLTRVAQGRRHAP